MDKDKEATEKVTKESVDSVEAEVKEREEIVELSKVGSEAAAEKLPQAAKKPHRLKRFLSTKKGKAIVVIGVILVVCGILLVVPMTRYGILGTFMKKNVAVMVMDSSTMKPVSQATVTLGDKSIQTNKNGEVVLDNIPVGEYTLKVMKSYYKTSEVAYEVPVTGEIKQSHVSLIATGRQVVLNVSNKITGAVLAGATITVQDTSAITDDTGKATIVLPADKKTLPGKVSLDGYNQSAVEMKITDQADVNNVTLTPAGDVYYLSKQTGKINVMKSHLDGSSANVVVEGTGNENDHETVLLAARDWSYMALSAKRDVKKIGQLYLVDAKSGSLKTIDEGDAYFQLVGWSDHKFIYVVTRNNANSWEPKTQRLKSYDAETGKLTILDENTAVGTNAFDYQHEVLQNSYILNGKIVYSKTWEQNYNNYVVSDKKSAIMAINPDGSQKQRIKEFTMQRNISINAKLYEPQEIYFRVVTDNNPEPIYYEYENNEVKSVSNTDDKFFNTYYPTYLISPNSQKTFWHEPRDGKNTLIVGDKNGKDGVTVAAQSEYSTYGWYGDKYLLISKNGSELYITSSDRVLEQPLKITNYHKPNISFPGYGYGYGGL